MSLSSLQDDVAAAHAARLHAQAAAPSRKEKVGGDNTFWHQRNEKLSMFCQGRSIIHDYGLCTDACRPACKSSQVKAHPEVTVNAFGLGVGQKGVLVAC